MVAPQIVPKSPGEAQRRAPELSVALDDRGGDVLPLMVPITRPARVYQGY